VIHAISVAGARPNLIKIKPVIDGLESLGARTTFVHSGQHYDEAMSGVFLGDLGLLAFPHRHPALVKTRSTASGICVSAGDRKPARSAGSTSGQPPPAS
jgi:UDP-N-acetylglucosamine 2-epimerase